MASNKQKKRAIEDDLICPITLELPFDPVTAEDGTVYERAAIKQYFATKGPGKVKSPSKGVMMGQVLKAAPHVKNIIETSIQRQYIKGDLAKKWKEKEKQRKEKVDLLKAAEQGDSDSMFDVAFNYGNGEDGFEQDYEMADHWCSKASAAGDATAMAKKGEFLVGGFGVAKDEKKGLLYLGMAAGRGSAFAAYILAKKLWAEGEVVPVDKPMAVRLLEKALSGSCAYDDMCTGAKEDARKVLGELKSQES